MNGDRGSVARSFDKPSVTACAILATCLALAACSAAPYRVGHAKRALEPAGFPQAESSQKWDVAAVRVTEGAGGHDYTGTKLLPVLLVFKNKGPGQPQVILEDVRGVGAYGCYLVYAPDEALRLALERPWRRRAETAVANTAVGAGVGAALGAGAGTLAYLLGNRADPSLIWKGTAVGGAAGGVIGAASGNSSVPQDTREAIRADLNSNLWQEDPITPGTIRMGYLLLPEGQGIQSVRITIRDEEGSETRTLRIATANEYDPEKAKAAPVASRPPVKPVEKLRQDAPPSRNIPEPLEI